MSAAISPDITCLINELSSSARESSRPTPRTCGRSGTCRSGCACGCLEILGAWSAKIRHGTLRHRGWVWEPLALAVATFLVWCGTWFYLYMFLPSGMPYFLILFFCASETHDPSGPSLVRSIIYPRPSCCRLSASLMPGGLHPRLVVLTVPF